MKLYLSSYLVPDLASFTSLVGKPVQEIKMALIPNSKDYYGARAKAIKMQNYVNKMSALGLGTEIVDLIGYSDVEQLRQKLSNFDVIWMCGGNTFCLRSAIRVSGLENFLTELLENGIVYGGDSAGAIVAGNTLMGTDIADEPLFAENIIYDGLGLAPVVIMPHANSNSYADKLPKIREIHKNTQGYIELNDWEVLIIDGDKQQVGANDNVRQNYAS